MLKLSRRDLVRGTAASAALSALPAGRAGAEIGKGPFDIVIVGAGPGGIGAGRRLRQAGLTNFVILEALPDRIGGRAFTDTTSFPGITWDQGCQWFHQVTPKFAPASTLAGPANIPDPGSAETAAQAALRVKQLTNNILFNIALARGIPVFPAPGAILNPDLNPRLLIGPPGKVNLLNSPVLKTELLVAIEALVAGFAARSDPLADVSVATASAGLSSNRWYELVAGILGIVLGGEIDQLSCVDVYVESVGGALSGPMVPSLDNWLISTGYGAFIVSLARGLPVRQGVVVDQIDWQSSGRVSLRTNQGTVSAKAVIVTPPVSVIPKLFNGSLPPAYQGALDGLAMGTDAKIGLLFAKNYRFDVLKDNTFVTPYINTRATSLVQTRVFGHDNFAIVIVAGKDIPTLEANGQLVPYALDQIVSMFGSAARRAFRRGVASRWNTSLFSLGSYSFAHPGGVPGREELAKPLANRVFFAGEAVNTEQHSSAHGAFSSGQRAARNALKAIGVLVS
jgi:monoamine oxidase